MSTELFDAVDRHDLTQLAALLAAGANPNIELPSQPSWPPLKLAVEELEEGGPIEAVVLLLRHGARPDGGAEPGGATPLIVAAMYGRVDAARLLLAAGADPNVRDDEGDSPLRRAVEKKNHELASLLLLCGANRTINDAGGFSGMNALGRAASNLDIPMIQLLLAAGADPELPDADRQIAREHLPPQDESNRPTWEAAVSLLSR